MQYEWDENKNAANKEKHGVYFSAAERFCWETALETIGDRADYDEKRWIPLVLIGARLYVMIYTLRGSNISIISLRKANRRRGGTL